VQGSSVGPGDLIAISVESALERMSPAAVIIPTRTGTTARHIARFRLPVWITAVSTEEAICQGLQFSYGVFPVHAPEDPEDWRAFARAWLRVHEIPGHLVILTQGPSPKHPDDNFRMEIMDLARVIREESRK
jgi:pyruvate kinase